MVLISLSKFSTFISLKKYSAFISFCLSFLSAQDYLDALIQDVLHGSRDSAAIYLPTMEQRYPNNPSLMYLKGLLETKGEEAKTIFAKLYNTHPTSDYGDDAVMKVAEYYYAAGLYVQAANWLKKMPIYYSRSEHIERAVKLFLNSLIVSGHKDTAIFYSRVFKRQFPALDVDGKIKDLLKDFEKSDQEKKKAKKLAPIITEPENSIVEYENKIPAVQFNYDNSDGIYSLQTGAYSVSENAESQKINLIIVGFKARINKLYKSNRGRGDIYAHLEANYHDKVTRAENFEKNFYSGNLEFGKIYKNFLALYSGILSSDNISKEIDDLTKNIFADTNNVYKFNVDKNYNLDKSGLGGPYHRLHDESHTLHEMAKKVKDAVPDDSNITEFIAFINEFAKDVQTTMEYKTKSNEIRVPNPPTPPHTRGGPISHPMPPLPLDPSAR